MFSFKLILNVKTFIYLTMSFFFQPNIAYSHENFWEIPDLNIGQPNIQQMVFHTKIYDGIDYYKVLRGFVGSNEEFVISSGVLSPNQINEYVRLLDSEDIHYTIKETPENAPDGSPLGKIIQVRDLRDQSHAEEIQNILLKNHNLRMYVRYSAQDGYPTTGPFIIHVLKVDLQNYEGSIDLVLANDTITGGETLKSMVDRTDSLVGVNAGYFVFNNKVGDIGAPAGVYVKDGELLREATNGRPVLIVENKSSGSNIAIGNSIKTEIFVKINNNARIRIDGLNRRPGLILNCGGYDDIPSDEPIHDYLCQDGDEVIAFNKSYGEITPHGIGTELVVDAKGKVVDIKDSMGSIIKDGFTYIQTTGNSSLPIKLGDILDLQYSLSIDGKNTMTHPGLSIVSAGPTLVDNYEVITKNKMKQGWNPTRKLNIKNGQNQDKDSLVDLSSSSDVIKDFYNEWVLRRHPRTAIGYDENGQVFLVIVNGRNRISSQGANITEIANVMKSLGVIKALNLDGGRSSNMVIKNTVLDIPQENQLRKISDAIVFHNK